MKRLVEVELKNKTKRKNRYIFLKLALVIFALYMCFVMVNQQIEINKKQIKLNSIRQELKEQNASNAELKGVLNADTEHTEEYIEKIARERLGLSKQNEKIYIGVTVEE